jgi:hypothetical protein
LTSFLKVPDFTLAKNASLDIVSSTLASADLLCTLLGFARAFASLVGTLSLYELANTAVEVSNSAVAIMESENFVFMICPLNVFLLKV